jgi:metal-sulfur cluster biosynthetic enzyme
MFNPSIAHSNTGVQISMNLKDKMCLLNGDLGGEIHSAVEFSYQD